MPGLRRKIGALFIGGALLAVGLSVILLAHGHRRLSYQGKSLAYWAGQLPLTLVVANPSGGSNTMTVTGARIRIVGNNPPPAVETPEDSLRAIRAIGSGAVPFLLGQLKTRDTPLKGRIQQWATRLGFKGQLFTPAIFARGQAVSALMALKPLPEGAVKELLSLSTNADRNIVSSAGLVLANEPRENPHETDTVIIHTH